MPVIRSFTASDIAVIMQNISGIRMMIPNHVKLLPAERRSLFKLNTKRKDFAENALRYMKQNPDSVPVSLDVSACHNYLQMYHQYNELIDELEKLKKQMEDVKLHIGNEVMNITKTYFHSTRFAIEAGRKQLEPIYEQLKTDYAVGRNSRQSVAV
jgi:hypothetical protein